MLQMPPSIQIKVDGREMDSHEISKQLPLYRGSAFQDDVYIDYNIQLTHDGIDGTVKFGNETIIIEPLINWKKESFNDDYQNTKAYNKRLEVYPCIFYRPEDMKDNDLYVLPDAEVISKHYPQASRNTPGKSRVKRNTQYTECSLHLVADNKFYKDIGESDITKTVAEMIYVLTEVNKIFRNTDFNSDGVSDNIGFSVKEITIYATSLSLMANSDNASTYLTEFSTYNFDKVCLGAAFSSSKNWGSVLGTAWLASSDPGYVGGICEKRSDGKNYNTLIQTYTGTWGRLPNLISIGILAHELGHSFGSNHDPVGECLPGGKDGNYLMNPYSTNGQKPNHLLFSPCSIEWIYPVIVNKGSCFIQTTGLCGNGMKEGTEECDCGTSDICDLLDPSCTPSNVSESNPDLPCTIRRNDGGTGQTDPPPCQCSSVYSPCCTKGCQFAPSWKPCRFAGECVKPTNCSGTSGGCPQISFEPDKKLCNDNRNTCLSGRCIGSVCSYFDSTECDCDQGSFECHVCCLTETKQCLPAMISDTYISKSVGSPCNQMKGFCDEHMTCFLQDPYMDFMQLGNILSPKVMNEVGQWFQGYWYYVVAGIAGLLFVAAVFFATLRQKVDVQTSAFMYGQFMRIKGEAEMLKRYIEERKKSAILDYKRRIKKVKRCSKQMGLTKAFGRLKEFFPMTPDQDLKKVLKICSKEEMAVSLILMKGFPLRRLV